jgi:hypothetical protein
LKIRRPTADAAAAPAPTGRRRRLTAGFLLSLLAAAGGCSMFGDDGVPKSQRPSNGWQIVFSDTARSDGTIDFLITPVEGPPVTVSVPVTAGQADGDIAAAAAQAFSTSLKGRYDVTKDRGTEIHVAKTGRRQPNFSLTLVRLTAQNVKVDLDRE